MPSTDKLFAGSIPEIYERFLVPLIFESYALDLAKRVTKSAPQDVLETAAGTGVLTRALASRLPESTRITATDLNQPMLDHAAARQPNNRRIAWQQADALALILIVCWTLRARFGVARRALSINAAIGDRRAPARRPGGAAHIAFAGRPFHIDLRENIAALERGEIIESRQGIE